MTFHYTKCKGITRIKENALAGLIKGLSSTGEIKTAHISMYQCSTGHQKQSAKSHEDQEEGDFAPGSKRSAAKGKSDFEEETSSMS